MSRSRRRRGAAILEFTLAGIPLMFVWISIVQMGIGMWHYDTIQYAVKQAGGFIATHGGQYVASGNSPAMIKDAASVLSYWAIGIPRSQMNVTFTSGNQSHSCRLDNCLTDATTWPPTIASAPSTVITVRADYIWHNALAMVAPGPGCKVVSFGAFNLPGYTRQFILF